MVDPRSQETVIRLDEPYTDCPSEIGSCLDPFPVRWTGKADGYTSRSGSPQHSGHIHVHRKILPSDAIEILHADLIGKSLCRDLGCHHSGFSLDHLEFCLLLLSGKIKPRFPVEHLKTECDPGSGLGEIQILSDIALIINGKRIREGCKFLNRQIVGPVRNKIRASFSPRGGKPDPAQFLSCTDDPRRLQDDHCIASPVYHKVSAFFLFAYLDSDSVIGKMYLVKLTEAGCRVILQYILPVLQPLHDTVISLQTDIDRFTLYIK